VAPSWSRPDDAVRQAQLDAMKRRGRGSCRSRRPYLAGASVFEAQYPWLGYVRATAEASLVGGLADWFRRHGRCSGIRWGCRSAYRHRGDPQGAHRADPRQFRADHFLSRHVIAANLRAGPARERAARWLADPENSRRIARQIAAVARHRGAAGRKAPGAGA